MAKVQDLQEKSGEGEISPPPGSFVHGNPFWPKSRGAGMKPHGPRVLVKPDAQPETSSSGLVLPEDRHHIPTSGTVIAIGDGSQRLQQVRTMVIEKCLRLVSDPLSRSALRKYRDECQDTYHTVSEGDRVVFPMESGLTIEEDGTTYILLHEDEIVIVEKTTEAEGVPV